MGEVKRESTNSFLNVALPALDADSDGACSHRRGSIAKAGVWCEEMVGVISAMYLDQKQSVIQHYRPAASLPCSPSLLLRPVSPL